jgi:hypothetical protein
MFMRRGFYCAAEQGLELEGLVKGRDLAVGRELLSKREKEGEVLVRIHLVARLMSTPKCFVVRGCGRDIFFKIDSFHRFSSRSMELYISNIPISSK